jgi:hypothetical protein
LTRTPLQSILGFSELGQMRSREQPRLADMFGDIHGAGQRVLALVNDLMDLAKVESRRTGLARPTPDRGLFQRHKRTTPYARSARMRWPRPGRRQSRCRGHWPEGRRPAGRNARCRHSRIPEPTR